MEMKRFNACFKSVEDEGRGLAVIATIGAIDKDNDVTEPGAFGEQTAKLAAAHNWQAPNIGMARIRESGKEALAEFQFYLDMPTAREWYTALKNNFANRINQEWSYGFNVIDSGFGEFEGRQVRFLRKLLVHEVSPVMVGAGVDTRTLDLKEKKVSESKAFEIQTLIFPKSKWDSADACKQWAKDHDFRNDKVDETEDSWRLRQKEPDLFERLRTICLSPDRDTPLEDCKVKAVGGPLKSAEMQEGGKRLEEHFDFVESSIAEARSLFDRAKALAALREKEGRTLSRVNRERLGSLNTRLDDLMRALSDVRGDIDSLLHETDPDRDIQALASQFAAYQHTLAKLGGFLS